jgi:hypothetical protein
MKLSLQLMLEVPPALPAELVQRVHDARYSGKLSDCESAVLDLLVGLPSGPHAGKAKALQISEMQRIWTRSGIHVWPDRSVKDAVKQLLEVHHVPIGSSRAAGCSGYFLLADIEDMEAAKRPLRGELLSIAKRLRSLDPKCQFARALVGQLSIDSETQQ